MAKSTGFCFVEFDKRGTLIDAKPEEPGWRYQTDKERQWDIVTCTIGEANSSFALTKPKQSLSKSE